MKAIVLSRYGSPDDLQLRDVPIPTPRDDEVLIKACAASINDWDWCLVRGTPFYIRLLCGLRRPKVSIPGVDIAGRVAAVGKNVKRYQPGDEVYGDLSESGFGAFAEYVCANEDVIAPKPLSMSFVEAAAVPHASMLAMQGICDKGQLRSGDRFLINGAGGGVGTLGVQIARNLGVKDITGVDSADKLEMMRSVGFQSVIDYRDCNFTSTGRRYDVVLDTKTNRSAFAYARALLPGGTYVTVGGDTAKLIQSSLLGPLISIFCKRKFCVVALKPNKDLGYINKLSEAGQLKPVIDSQYALKDVPKAIQRFGGGKHLGKVVVVISES